LDDASAAPSFGAASEGVPESVGVPPSVVPPSVVVLLLEPQAANRQPRKTTPRVWAFTGTSAPHKEQLGLIRVHAERRRGRTRLVLAQ
jgi:hypothetical protein